MRKGGYDEKLYIMYCDLRHVEKHEGIKDVVSKALEVCKKRYEVSPLRGRYGMTGLPKSWLKDGWKG